MTTSLSQLLDEIRSIKRSEKDVGDRFEEIVQVYFNHDAQMQSQYEDAVSWSEWVRREDIDETKQDTGIDLVAKIRLEHGGGHAAVQAKCYDRDTILQRSHIDSFYTKAKTFGFERLIFVDTTETTPSKHFQEIVDKNQITHIRVHDLEDSTVDWDAFVDRGERSRHAQKEPRPHQIEAVARIQEGLRTADRGQLIMACGTGKTYTGLLLAEQAFGIGKRVLVLVPSLALMSQMIREWHADATIPLRSYSVCSDSEVGRKGRNADDVIQLTPSELKLPPTTDAFKLAQSAKHEDTASLTVVFGTYHSLEVIHAAQHQFGLPNFDLIVCDEAHRTTGQYDKGKEDEASMFVRVHDANYVRSTKRLYMTATPRIYTTASKSKASEGAIELCSMDDPTKFGKVWFYKSFAWAVEQNLLSDYRVLVLAVDEQTISRDLQKVLESDDSDIKLDDATKVVGCYKALMKVSGPGREEEFRGDTAPSRRVLAFCNTINNSKIISKEFDRVVQELAPDHIAGEASPTKFTCSTKHIDGTSGAHQRNRQLTWLGDEPNKHELRILSNVRCLGEGVDVPSLDAIVFFHPRKSQIDVVQAVGRVMRRAPNKQYGYVVLPVAIPTGKSPEQALRDNKTYDTVWQILNALRAHDERLEAEINRLQLEGEELERVMVKLAETAKGTVQFGSGDGDRLELMDKPPSDEDEPPPIPFDLVGSLSKEFAAAIYAQIVRRVGRKAYWEDWAHDVGKIAQTQTTRIRSALNRDEHSRRIFQEFLAELQDDLNPAVTEDQAIELLAQHIITRPVFNALFSGHEFIEQNSVSIAMEKVLNELDQRQLEKETESLQNFYKEVKWRIEGTKTAGAKQHLVKELYDKFFRKAFPRTTEMLGIAFTPVEIVDYVIHSIEHLMQKHFNKSLSDEGVHIIDPFVGTGTFITRLLQSGIIRQEDLRRKYEEEIHANEIVLLAYYVAGINIEAVYHEIRGEDNGAYEPYERIVFQDTFQSVEHANELKGIFPLNHERIDSQRHLPLNVVLGNPPYSRGQKSQNDNAQNVQYVKLESRLANTYVKASSAKLKNMLYDSYFRAFRWASDRLADRGIVGFVTGAGWLNGNAASGVRACFEKEFAHIYVVNLRGNARTKGEDRRREAGNVFDAASRSAITLTFLVKDSSAKPPANIYYHDIGDYLKRDEKLGKLREFQSVENTPLTSIQPNTEHDWVNQRSTEYRQFLPLRSTMHDPISGIFVESTLGMFTGRDAWCYNFSKKKVIANMTRSIEFFNEEQSRYRSISVPEEPKNFVNYDKTKIAWNMELFRRLSSGQSLQINKDRLIQTQYRPFTRIWCYFDPIWITRIGGAPNLFNTVDTRVLSICTSGIGAATPDSWLADTSTDLGTMTGGCRMYPLYASSGSNRIFDDLKSERSTTLNVYNVVPPQLCSAVYPNFNATPRQVFNYVYGILQCSEFVGRFNLNLQKELPRVPLVASLDDFLTISEIGNKLAFLHANYDSVDEFPVCEHWEHDGDTDTTSKYRVEGMKFPIKGERSSIQYNSYLRLSGIPDDAYDFQVGGKSLVEWVMDRQRVTTHKDSGIVNDANDFAIETMNDPAYPLRLLKKAVTVGIKTRELQKCMPPLRIHKMMGG